MRVDILFDREAEKKGFSLGWGVSYLIEGHILFDTGEKFSYLENNARIMGVNLSNIDKVIISHDHWDHTGGLEGLLKKNKKIKVYACPDFSLHFKKGVKNLKASLLELSDFTKVDENIYSTGQILGNYKLTKIAEQSLILDTERGLVVICGCSHPGILKILKKVKENFPDKEIYLVFGGFHLIEEERRVVELISKEFKKIGLKKVGPSHCSGPDAEEVFKREFKDNFVEIKIGKTLHI